jgi:hypothetical protein
MKAYTFTFAAHHTVWSWWTWQKWWGVKTKICSSPPPPYVCLHYTVHMVGIIAANTSVKHIMCAVPSLHRSHGGHHSGKHLSEAYHVRRASISLKPQHILTPWRYITLLNDMSPHITTMRCWESNLNLNLPTQLFEHHTVIFQEPTKRESRVVRWVMLSTLFLTPSWCSSTPVSLL